MARLRPCSSMWPDRIAAPSHLMDAQRFWVSPCLWIGKIEKIYKLVSENEWLVFYQSVCIFIRCICKLKKRWYLSFEKINRRYRKHRLLPEPLWPNPSSRKFTIMRSILLHIHRVHKKIRRHKRDKTGEAPNQLQSLFHQWTANEHRNETTAFPFNHCSRYSFAVFGCDVACVPGDPLIIHITMHKSCIAWLDFRSHCYAGPLVSPVLCVARNCSTRIRIESREPLLFAEKSCIELFTLYGDRLSGAEVASGSMKRRDSTKWSSFTLIEKLIAFSRDAHIVFALANFVSSARTPLEINVEDACSVPLFEKCCAMQTICILYSFHGCDSLHSVIWFN